MTRYSNRYVGSSCHLQLALCCNNDHEKHLYCGEGTFELAAESYSSFTFVKCMAGY